MGAVFAPLPPIGGQYCSACTVHWRTSVYKRFASKLNVDHNIRTALCSVNERNWFSVILAEIIRFVLVFWLGLFQSKVAQSDRKCWKPKPKPLVHWLRYYHHFRCLKRRASRTSSTAACGASPTSSRTTSSSQSSTATSPSTSGKSSTPQYHWWMIGVSPQHQSTVVST